MEHFIRDPAYLRCTNDNATEDLNRPEGPEKRGVPKIKLRKLRELCAELGATVEIKTVQYMEHQKHSYKLKLNGRTTYHNSCYGATERLKFEKECRKQGKVNDICTLTR